MKYHTRWNALNANEINQLFIDHVDTYKGFVALQGNFEGKNYVPDYDSINDTELSEFNTEILNDIYELVTANGAELILMIAPYESGNAYLHENVKAEIKWAKDKSVTVLDYSLFLEELGIDPECDYFDGSHLDISGARKLSLHFAAFMNENGIGENTLIDKVKWQADYDAYVNEFPTETGN